MNDLRASDLLDLRAASAVRGAWRVDELRELQDRFERFMDSLGLEIDLAFVADGPASKTTGIRRIGAPGHEVLIVGLRPDPILALAPAVQLLYLEWALYHEAGHPWQRELYGIEESSLREHIRAGWNLDRIFMGLRDWERGFSIPPLEGYLRDKQEGGPISTALGNKRSEDAVIVAAMDLHADASAIRNGSDVMLAQGLYVSILNLWSVMMASSEDVESGMIPLLARFQAGLRVLRDLARVRSSRDRKPSIDAHLARMISGTPDSAFRANFTKSGQMDVDSLPDVYEGNVLGILPATVHRAYLELSEEFTAFLQRAANRAELIPPTKDILEHLSEHDLRFRVRCIDYLGEVGRVDALEELARHFVSTTDDDLRWHLATSMLAISERYAGDPAIWAVFDLLAKWSATSRNLLIELLLLVGEREAERAFEVVEALAQSSDATLRRLASFAFSALSEIAPLRALRNLTYLARDPDPGVVFDNVDNLGTAATFVPEAGLDAFEGMIDQLAGKPLGESYCDIGTIVANALTPLVPHAPARVFEISWRLYTEADVLADDDGPVHHQRNAAKSLLIRIGQDHPDIAVALLEQKARSREDSFAAAGLLGCVLQKRPAKALDVMEYFLSDFAPLTSLREIARSEALDSLMWRGQTFVALPTDQGSAELMPVAVADLERTFRIASTLIHDDKCTEAAARLIGLVGHINPSESITLLRHVLRRGRRIDYPASLDLLNGADPAYGVLRAGERLKKHAPAEALMLMMESAKILFGEKEQMDTIPRSIEAVAEAISYNEEHHPAGFFEHLAPYLSDADSRIAAAAMLSLGWLRAAEDVRDSTAALWPIVAHEKGILLRCAAKAVANLAKVAPLGCVPLLILLAENEDERITWDVAEGAEHLAEVAPESGLQLLRTLCQRSTRVKQHAVRALRAYSSRMPEAVVKTIESIAWDPDDGVRSAAVEAATGAAPHLTERVLSLLESKAGDSDDYTVQQVAVALRQCGRLDRDRTLRILRSLIAPSRSWGVNRVATVTLLGLFGPRDIQAILESWEMNDAVKHDLLGSLRRRYRVLPRTARFLRRTRATRVLVTDRAITLEIS